MISQFFGVISRLTIARLFNNFDSCRCDVSRIWHRHPYFLIVNLLLSWWNFHRLLVFKSIGIFSIGWCSYLLPLFIFTLNHDDASSLHDGWGLLELDRTPSLLVWDGHGEGDVYGIFIDFSSKGVIILFRVFVYACFLFGLLLFTLLDFLVMSILLLFRKRFYGLGNRLFFFGFMV